MSPRLFLKPLTERQKDAYDWIVRHVEKTGEWPTFREIQSGLGYPSPNSITQIIKALVKKEWLIKRDTHYDFASTDMPYLTPQIKNRMFERLVQELARVMPMDKAQSTADSVLRTTLADIPSTRPPTDQDQGNVLP